MKPVYEIVRAEELQVGDVIKENARDWLMTVAVVNTDERCVQVDHGPPFGFKTQVFRQLPPERNPDVLMGALEMAASQVLRLAHTLRRDADYFPIEENVELYVTSCIGKAIRELKSEAVE